MIELSVENLHLTYGDNPVLKGVSMELKRGEVVSLLGPSGSGKTTLLRAVAGLEKPTSGIITIGKTRVYDGNPRSEIPAEARNLGLVFQSYALWPHKTVFENVAYPLKLRKVAAAEIKQRVQTVLEQLGLGHLGNRHPHQLSGGQQQRVAIGRALVYNPPVILLDEPLSNLDAKLRVQTRTQIAALQQRLGVTTVYVTHDQVEAMTMGDRVAVMKDGVLQQVDSPLALYDTPKNLFVAGFIGSPAMNLMEGDVVDGGVKLGDYIIPVSRDVLVKAPNETKLTLGIRPESFTLANEGIGLDVAVVEELGADAYLYGSLVGSGEQASIENGEAHQVVARISSRRPPQRGEQVRLGVNPAAVHVFSQETTERIS